ncbi:MAG: recombinase family protein [Lachnospiraceae bacterium]|nr:recombinase family protein [Lachnospiraceae bacterium]
MSEKQAKVYGYARVSTREQNEDRQIIALKEMGVPEDNIFVDKLTGSNFDRPQYKRLLRKLGEDSVLYIKSIDRLGRSYRDLSEQWRIITKDKGSDVVVIDMPILDTRREKNLLGTLISDLVLALLSYVAEAEYRTIHQRQAEGIAAAKARGIRMGRPPKPLPENFQDVYQKWKHKKISISEAAKECGMPKTTFYEKAKVYEKARIKNI